MSEVILLAIADSLGTVSTCSKGITRKHAAQEARIWLQLSPVCRHYCTLLNINHEAMLERLTTKWQDDELVV